MEKNPSPFPGMGSNSVPTYEGGPLLNADDWRGQLQTGSRQRIVNKIMETLKRHLPFSGQEGLQELKKIAVRFEEKIYAAATSQSDYLRKISLKMLTMETKQNPLPNPLASNSALNNNRFPDAEVPQVQNLNQPAPLRSLADQSKEQLLEQVMKQKVELVNLKQTLLQLQAQQQNLLRPTQQQPSQKSGMESNSVPAPAPYGGDELNRTADEGDPMLNANDWRGKLLAGCRQRIVTKILEVLKRHLPLSGQEDLQELRMRAARFEEKIYSAATTTSQADYLRKISLKMITLETKSSQNPLPNLLASNSALNNNKFPDPEVPQSTLPRAQNLKQPAPLQHNEQLLEKVKKQKVELVNLKQTLQIKQEDLSGMQPSSTESSSSPLPILQQNQPPYTARTEMKTETFLS